MKDSFIWKTLQHRQFCVSGKYENGIFFALYKDENKILRKGIKRWSGKNYMMKNFVP